MSINRPSAGIVSLAVAATALVASISSPAFAAQRLDAPQVVSAELTSASGDGCGQPAVRLGDGTLDVQAQTGGDASLLLGGSEAAGGSSAATECVLQVYVQLDQPGRVRPSQYLMSGTVNTSTGTVAGHYFESSFDAAGWHGQRSTLPAGSVGPFAQGGGSRFDPWSDCSTGVDVSFRVGLSLTSTAGLSAADATALDAPNGAVAELDTAAC
jgi:hypothetical protein